MSVTIPDLTLNNGIGMPQLGLGVYLSEGEELTDAIRAAVADGYRLVDTAAFYGNEEGVGRGIRECGVPRDELFVTTKLSSHDHGHDRALAAFDRSLTKLGLDHVDLYLVHWPLAFRDDFADTWRAMEEIYRSGRARAIGVCNYTPAHLDRLARTATITPAVNQVELHPYLQQREQRAADRSRGIVTQAWSPLGRGAVLHDETLARIGRKYGKTVAQVVIRWHLQLGLSVIPKSVHAERIRQNADVFDFALDPDDLAAIEALDRGGRTGPDPDDPATADI